MAIISLFYTLSAAICEVKTTGKPANLSAYLLIHWYTAGQLTRYSIILGYSPLLFIHVVYSLKLCVPVIQCTEQMFSWRFDNLTTTYTPQ